MKKPETATPKQSSEKEHYFCPEVGATFKAKNAEEAEKAAAKLEKNNS